MLVYIETEEFIRYVLTRYDQHYSNPEMDATTAVRLSLEEALQKASSKVARKQTSSRMSSLAGKYMNWQAPFHEWEELAKDIRSMAASIVSQDETEGQ